MDLSHLFLSEVENYLPRRYSETVLNLRPFPLTTDKNVSWLRMVGSLYGPYKCVYEYDKGSEFCLRVEGGQEDPLRITNRKFRD